MALKLVALAALFAVSFAADECGQFPTCETCLNNAFCGWCSPSDVVYANGTYGARCADQRDDQWNCYHLYQTTKCLAGYVCDQAAGQCKLTDPGEGDTKENCEKTCKPPVKQYHCNSEKGVCEECPDYDPTCQDDKSACDSSCEQEKRFTCDEDTLTCVEDPYGSTESGCDASCQKETPSELVGLWRGTMVQSEFDLGEWAFNFTTDSVTVLSVKDGNSFTGSVGVANGVMMISFAEGPFAGSTIKGLSRSVQSGPETNTYAFAFGAPNKNAPSSVDAAMFGGGFTVFVMSKCNSWSGACDFSSVFKNANAKFLRPASFVSAKHRYLTPVQARGGGMYGAVGGSVTDLCNQYTTCPDCLGAPSGLCGWCTGEVVYKNDSSIQGVQCAGFQPDGSVPEFTCTPEYRRISCVDYVCDWSGAEPECRETKDGESGQPKETACAWCEASKLYKCDVDTQTCVECEDGETGASCLDQANCGVVCGQTYSYCDRDGGFVCANTTYDDPRVHTQPCDDTCAAPVYFSCDYTTGTCNGGCTLGTPGCDTKAYCDAVCVPSNVTGVWRGVQINMGFDAGEFDFVFYSDKTVAWMNREGDEAGKVYRATYEESGSSTSESAVSFDMTITASPDAALVGEKLSGMYKTASGYGKPVDFMYLAWGNSNTEAPATFDDAMAAGAGKEFVLAKCQDGEMECDFSKAIEGLEHA